jgi:hypothetical protein
MIRLLRYTFRRTVLSMFRLRFCYLHAQFSVVLFVTIGSLLGAAATPPDLAVVSTPLEYVRSAIVMPPADLTPPPPPLPAVASRVPKSDSTRKAALARLREREFFVALRGSAAASVGTELTAGLGRLGGFAVHAGSVGSGAIMTRGVNGALTIDPAAASSVAREGGSGVAIITAVDRFGAHTRVQREVWLRAVAYAVSATGDVRGPFHAVGVARASRMLLRRGFSRTDEQLVEEASARAARLLTRALETGREAPFCDDARIAVVPATSAECVTPDAQSSAVPEPIRLPALQRQLDVLLQPDLPPVIVRVEADEVDRALAILHKTPADLWPSSDPDAGAVCALAARLGAQFVFLSRVTRLALSDGPADVRDGKTMRPGIERHVEAEAEAALVRASDGLVVWRESAPASTTSHTVFARGRPRIRSVEKCVLDVVHAAYGLLRLSFDDYRLRAER